MRCIKDQTRLDRKLTLVAVIALTNASHKECNKWDQDKDDPSTNCKLRERDDDKDHTCYCSADTIQDGLCTPTLTANISPVNHHAGLANGETKKDANGVCGNQQGDKGTSRNKEDHGTSRNRNDATPVCEPITPLPNLSRKEAVTSQDPCELWPTVESGVGGEEQNAGRCNLEDYVGDSTAERSTSNLREERLTANLLRDLSKRKGEK